MKANKRKAEQNARGKVDAELFDWFEEDGPDALPDSLCPLPEPKAAELVTS